MTEHALGPKTSPLVRVRRAYNPLQILGFHVLLPDPSFPPRGGQREVVEDGQQAVLSGRRAQMSGDGERARGPSSPLPHQSRAAVIAVSKNPAGTFG